MVVVLILVMDESLKLKNPAGSYLRKATPKTAISLSYTEVEKVTWM